MDLAICAKNVPMRKIKMKEFKVWSYDPKSPTKRGKHIDTVFFNKGFSAKEVRQSLIDNDFLIMDIYVTSVKDEQ